MARGTVTVAATLSVYVGRQFTGSVLAMIASLTGLVSLFDLIELLRRGATRDDVGFGLLVEIAALRLPFFAIEILPFAVLLGGIISFWRLTRSSELIVARAAGISAWQFLAAPLACAILIGVAATALVSPLSSVLYARAERLDDIHLKSGSGQIELAGGQLWLRQSDAGLVPNGVALLHARRVDLHHHRLDARGISIFRLDPHDRLLSRIEADRGQLADGAWLLTGARSIRPDQLPVAIGAMRFPTELTVHRVQEGFASPDTLSVWALPGFISLLEHAGFSAIRHRLRYQSLLALPLLSGTMVLVAAGFSMRPARRGGVARMVGGGITFGFALFIVSKVAEEFGRSGALPPVLAAWAPAGSGLLLALTMLLHLEDG